MQNEHYKRRMNRHYRSQNRRRSNGHPHRSEKWKDKTRHLWDRPIEFRVNRGLIEGGIYL